MRFFKPSFCIYVSMLKSFVFILTSSPTAAAAAAAAISYANISSV
jgi:hypothetical protein